MSNEIQSNVIDAIVKPVEVNDEIARRELASTVTGFFEEFNVLLSNLKSFCTTLEKPDDKTELEKHTAHLESLINVLDCDHLTENNNLSNIYKSKIERLGITNQVIKAKESGHTLKQISDTFDISIYHIRKFFEVYSNSSLVVQTNMRRKSVFDVTDRLEELTTLIRRQLSNLEADPRNQVAYVKEMRECIQLAAEITDKIVITNQLRQMTEVVGEVLLNEVPIERRQAVLTRLAEVESFGWIQAQIKGS